MYKSMGIKKLKNMFIVILIFAATAFTVSSAYAQPEDVSPLEGEDNVVEEIVQPENEDIPPAEEILPPESEDMPPVEEILPPENGDAPSVDEVMPPESEGIPPTDETLLPEDEGVSEPDVILPENQETPPAGNSTVPEVEILPPASNEAPTTYPETVVPNVIIPEADQGETIVEVTETRLSSLGTSKGELYPAFEPDIYEYILYVEKPKAPSDIVFSCVPIDPLASILDMGKIQYHEEDVIVPIEVRGTGEWISTYHVTVHIVKYNELLLNGSQLYLAQENINLDMLPSGFSEETVEYKGGKLSSVQSADKKIILVQYYNSADLQDNKWYSLDTKKKKLSEAHFIKIKEQTYYVADKDKQILYGSGKEGIGYYEYDAKEKKLGAFIGDTLDDKKFSYVSFVIGIPIVLFVMAIFAMKKKKTSNTIKTDEPIAETNSYFIEHLYFDEED